MSSIDLLPPENFHVPKRKEIAKRCYQKLPEYIQDRLKDGYEAAIAGDGGQLVAYLRSDGAPIWESYITEIANSKLGRDFTPLTSGERQEFSNVIKDSFDLADKQEANRKVKVSTRRFWAGVTLLLIGFIIIATTYWVIPKLATTLYQERQAALKDTSLEDITEIQAGLAYRGTAPAVIMLFAIGGMFVTFGLSSLLKWMKLSERSEQMGENRAQLLLMSQIGSLLLSHGIEPSSFLERIQSGAAHTEEHGASAPQLPISITLAEIAKMLNVK